MVWLRNGNLGCDTCEDVYLSLGHQGTTMMAARAKGWHIYEGPSETGKELTTHLSPKCVGTPRSLPNAPRKIPGDALLPLFSEAA